MSQNEPTGSGPSPKIPAPGTSETFPAYPEGGEAPGIDGIPVPDPGGADEPGMTVQTTGSEGNTDTLDDEDSRGSRIDHPTDGTDSEDRPSPDR